MPNQKPSAKHDWGWTSYRRTGWIDKAGRRCYETLLSTTPTPKDPEFETVRLLFWAHRPILALRAITSACLSGKRLLSKYDGQVVN